MDYSLGCVGMIFIINYASFETMTSDTYRVYGKDGRLYIEEGDNGSHEPVFVRVYGIGGFLVWNGQISDQATIFLPHGFYIVEIGKTICRISL